MDQLPSGDFAVFALLSTFSAAFAVAFVEAMLADKPWYVSVGCFVAAIVLFLAGIKWPQIKFRLGQTLASAITRIASDPRYRWGAALLIIGYFVISGVIFIHDLRNDLDTYVMPREITPKQSAALKQYLSQHESGSVWIECAPYDLEADNYASQIFWALHDTNWDVDPPGHGGPTYIPLSNPPEPKPNDVDVKGKPLYRTFPEYQYAHNQWVESEIREEVVRQYVYTGVQINVEKPGPPENPDLKHPSLDTILSDGFKYAKIDEGHGGGTYDMKQSRIVIVVGRRPEAITSVSPLRLATIRFFMKALQ